MPYDISVDPTRKLLVVRVYGVFEGADTLAMADEIRRHPLNEDGLRHLYDFSDADVTAESLAMQGEHHEVAVLLHAESGLW